jgi:hypothetical protein
MKYRFSIACWLILVACRVEAARFQKECGLPYNARGKHHAIDDTCSKHGDIPANDTDVQQVAHREQNDLKNRLCAIAPVITVTFTVFRELQDAVDDQVDRGAFHYGVRDVLPEDRGPLHNIQTSAGSLSEGDLVELEAVLIQSKKGSSTESCNCGTQPVIDSDIHLALGKSRSAQDCEVVVAEMIPHWRPEVWHWTKLRDLEGTRVRIRGQLFFDASHHPCGPQKSDSDPDRSTVWEIHPVYTMEVKDQEAESGSVWVSVQDYLR